MAEKNDRSTFSFIGSPMTRLENTLLLQNPGDIDSQLYNQMQQQQCNTFFPVLATPDMDEGLLSSLLNTVGET